MLWPSVPNQPKVIIKLRQFLTWLGTPSELKSKGVYQIPLFLGDYQHTKCLKYWYIPSRYNFKEPYWTRTFPPELISQNFPGNLIFADSYNTVSTFIEHHFQPNLITQSFLWDPSGYEQRSQTFYGCSLSLWAVVFTILFSGFWKTKIKSCSKAIPMLIKKLSLNNF